MAFSAKDVFEITGVKRERLQKWNINPSIKKGSGPGRWKFWALDDLYKIKICSKFMDAGFPRDMVTSLIGQLPTDLIINDKTLAMVAFVRNEETVGLKLFPKSEWLKNGLPRDLKFDDIVIVNVEKIKAEIFKAAKDHYREFFK